MKLAIGNARRSASATFNPDPVGADVFLIHEIELLEQNLAHQLDTQPLIGLIDDSARQLIKIVRLKVSEVNVSTREDNPESSILYVGHRIELLLLQKAPVRCKGELQYQVAFHITTPKNGYAGEFCRELLDTYILRLHSLACARLAEIDRGKSSTSRHQNDPDADRNKPQQSLAPAQHA